MLTAECLQSSSVQVPDQIQAFLGLENQLNAQLTTIGPIGPENTVLTGFDLDTGGNLWVLGETGRGGRRRSLPRTSPTGSGDGGSRHHPRAAGHRVGLAIAPQTCPPPPEPVLIEPTFTG